MNAAVEAVPERAEPTLFGITLFQILAGLFLFLSLLHSRRDLAALCLLLLGIMALTRLWSAAGHRGLGLALSLDKNRGFPGEELRVRLAVANHRFLPLWVQAVLAPGPSLIPCIGAPGAERECGLLGYEEAVFEWTLAAQARGVYQVRPPVVRVADPLGFFARRKASGHATELVVYPRRVRLRHPAVPRRDFFGASGSESPVLDPVHILGTRDYQHSQPARHIHWKASARHDRLQEKVFEPSEQARVLFLLDVRPFAVAGAADDFERTLEVIGSWAVELDAKGQAFGLSTNGTAEGVEAAALPVSRSPRQIRALLELLARLKLEAADAQATFAGAGLPAPRGLTCVHFSYCAEALPEALCAQLARSKIPLVRVSAHLPSAGKEEPAATGAVHLLAGLSAAEASPP